MALASVASNHAQHHPLTATIDYRGGTSVEDLANDMAVNDNESALFDVICILEVLEHATDVDSLLSSASSLLKPDGTLFVSTVNKNMKSYLMAILGAEYIMGYLPPGTHTWDQFLSPQDVADKMGKVGMEVINVQGMVATAPPPIGNWNWKLDPQDVDVNWIGAYRHAGVVDRE